MKLNRTLVLCLSIVLAATMALGGTLAFLTDTETEVNLFTVGDVDIELEEEFEQGSQLMPGKEIGKSVWIQNVGANDAWVWYTWAVPANLADMIEVDHYDQFVVNDDPDHEYWEAPAGVFDGDDVCVTNVVIDGVEYVMYAAVHKTVLEPGEATPPCMRAVSLKSGVDYNPVTDTYHLVENGNVSEGVPAADLQNMKIIVTAYAFQADGFEEGTTNIYDVVELYKGQWGSLENAVGETVNAVAVTEVATAEELVAAVAEGGKIKLVDNIVLGEKLVIEGDKVVSIDLNGYALETAAVDGNYSVVVKGSLTIGTTNGGAMYIDGLYGIGTSSEAQYNPTLAIKGGNYHFRGDYMIGCFGGTATLYDGNFNGHNEGYCVANGFDGYNGLVIVYGANCENLNPDESYEFLGNYLDKREPQLELN